MEIIDHSWCCDWWGGGCRGFEGYGVCGHGRGSFCGSCVVVGVVGVVVVAVGVVGVVVVTAECKELNRHRGAEAVIERAGIV